MASRMVIGPALVSLLILGMESCLQAEEPALVGAQAARIRDLEKKVKDLEDIVRRVEDKLNSPAPPPPSPQVLPALPIPGFPTRQPVPGQTTAYQEGANPVPQDMARPSVEGAEKGTGSSGFNEGFYIQSADKQHTLRITGQIQSDYRQFLNHDDTADISTFLLRRARFGVEADLFNYYEFRFLPDFGQGKAVIQDCYLNIHYLDAFQLEVGKFKEPVSYEQLVQDRFVPTMERSIIDQLVPARDIGAMVHGEELFGNQFDWAIGVFNGEINGGSGPPASDEDTNRLKDVAARVAWRPLHYESLPDFVQYLQIGVAGTAGVENEAMNPLTLRLPSSVPFFAFNSTAYANGLRTRVTPEISYFFHGLGFDAQYYDEHQEISPSSISKVHVNVPFTGGQGTLTYLLTGEERTTYTMLIEPLRPFDPRHPFTNPGAWELVLRASHLDVGSEVFAAGPTHLADPTKYSDNVTELTAGFNWYLNSFVRMQLNYEHGWFANSVLLGNVHFTHSNALLTRFQIIF